MATYDDQEDSIGQQLSDQGKQAGLSSRGRSSPASFSSPVKPRDDYDPANPTLAKSDDQEKYESSLRTAYTRVERTKQEEDFRTRGQKFFTDANGDLRPLRDEQGRDLYAETNWAKAKDPKTGLPALSRRNSFGKQEYRAPKLRHSVDPADPTIYADFGPDGQEALGHVDDLAKHPDPAIAKQAAIFQRKRTAAMRNEALKPLQDTHDEAQMALDNAKLERNTAQQQAAELQKQIAEIDNNPELKATQGGILGIGAKPTEAAARLQAKRATLQEQADKLASRTAELTTATEGEGELARRAQTARLELDVWKTKAKQEQYADLAERRREVLRAQGKPEEGDKTLERIVAMQNRFGVGLSDLERTRKKLAEADEQRRQQGIAEAEAKMRKTWAPEDFDAENKALNEEATKLASLHERFQAITKGFEDNKKAGLPNDPEMVKLANDLRGQLIRGQSALVKRADTFSAAAQAAQRKNITDHTAKLDSDIDAIENGGFLAKQGFTFNYGRQQIDDALKRYSDTVGGAKKTITQPDQSGNAVTAALRGLGAFVDVAGRLPLSELKNLVGGATQADLDKIERWRRAKEVIGNFRGADAEKVLSLTTEFQDKLAKGEDIVASKAAGITDTARTLPEIQALVNTLRREDGAKGSALVLNDQFLKTLWSTLNVVNLVPGVDYNYESNKVNRSDITELAQFNALRGELGRLVQEKFPNSALSAQVAGSLSQFLLTRKMGGVAAEGAVAGTQLAAGRLGLAGLASRAAELAKNARSMDRMGEVAGYSAMGAAQEFTQNPESTDFLSRMLGVVTNAAVLGVTEKLGDRAGAVWGEMVKVKPTWGNFAARQGAILGGQAAGESLSDVLQAAWENQDYSKQSIESFAGNTGAVLGMQLAGLVGKKGAISVQKNYRAINSAYDIAARELTNRVADVRALVIASGEQTPQGEAARQALAALPAGKLEFITGLADRALAPAKGAKSIEEAYNDLLTRHGAALAAGELTQRLQIQLGQLQDAIPQAQGLPDFTLPPQVPGGQPVLDPATKDANRGAAMALVKLGAGVAPSQLTELERQGLQVIGQQIGSDMVTVEGGQVVIRDKARTWLTDQAPAAAKVIPRTEAEMLSAISQNGAGEAQTRGGPAATSRAPAPSSGNDDGDLENQKDDYSEGEDDGHDTPDSRNVKPPGATVTFNDETGTERAVSVPVDATIPSSGVAVTDAATAEQWLAESGVSKARDVRFNRQPAKPKPAAATRAPTAEASPVDLARNIVKRGRNTRKAVEAAARITKRINRAVASYGKLFSGVRLVNEERGSGGMHVDPGADRRLVITLGDLARAESSDLLTDERIDQLVREEAIHRAAMDLEDNGEWNPAELWSGLSDATKQAFTRAYNRGADTTDFSDRQMGHEMIRMIVQGRLSLVENGRLALDGVAISEDTVSPTLLEQIRDILKSLRDYFTNLAATLKRDGNSERSVEEVTQIADALTQRMVSLSQPDKPFQTKESVTGEAINEKWTAFAPESGTLGIPRTEMPQVKSEHRGALINFLNARGVTHESQEVLPGTLKPTQAEFSEAKTDKARAFLHTNRAILVSSDNYVVDGHHQYVAALHDAPFKPYPIIRLNKPIRELIPLMFEFPQTTRSSGANSKPATETAPAAEPQAQPQAATPPANEARTEERSPVVGQESRPAPEGQQVQGQEQGLLGRYGIPSDRIGRAETVTHKGDTYQVRYALVPSSSLITSNAPDGKARPEYPAELQPRDRSTGFYQEQQREIARNPNPGEARIQGVPDRGVPIVTNWQGRNIVLIGNGRQNANQLRYDSADYQDQAAAYRANILEVARERGIENVDGIEQPVLVRIIEEQMDAKKLQRISQESNNFAGASTNTVEQSRVDASRMNNEVLSYFQRGYEVGAKKNEEFRRQFVSKVIGKAENITEKDLERRIEAALFAKAYGDTEAGRVAFARLQNEDDKGVRSLLNGMLAASSDVAALNNGIQAGVLHPMPIGQELSRAVETIAITVRDLPKGKKIDAALNDIMGQADLAGVDERSELEREVFRFLVENRGNASEVERVIVNYTNLVHSLGDPNQEQMFGSQVSPAVEYWRVAQQEAPTPDEQAKAAASGREALQAGYEASWGLETRGRRVSVDRSFKGDEVRERVAIGVKEAHAEAEKQKPKFLRELADSVAGIHGLKLQDDRRKDEKSHRDPKKQKLVHTNFKFAIKALDTALAKILRKPKVPSDLLRWSVISSAQTPEGVLEHAIKLIEHMGRRGYKIYAPNGVPDFENRYLHRGGLDGYRDIGIKFVKDDGKIEDRVVKEVLVLQPEMAKAKFATLHKLYERKRAMDNLIADGTASADALIRAEREQSHYKGKMIAIGEKAFQKDNPGVAQSIGVSPSGKSELANRSSNSSSDRSSAKSLKSESGIASSISAVSRDPSSVLRAFSTSNFRSATDRAFGRSDGMAQTPTGEDRNFPPKSGETAGDVYAGVLQSNHRLVLANGWKVKRSLLNGDHVVEVVGPNYLNHTELSGVGIMPERVGYNIRYFMPPATMRGLLEISPVAQVDRNAPLYAGAEGPRKRRGKPADGLQTEIFEGGGPTEDLTLLGEEAKDYEGITDRQAALVEAKQQAARDQMSLFSGVETPEFKRWFGDSKVVDGQGKPLVVYHGTANSFDEFIPQTWESESGRGARGGFYFTTNPRYASAFASMKGQGGGDAVMPVFVKIERPFDASGFGVNKVTPLSLRRALMDAGVKISPRLQRAIEKAHEIEDDMAFWQWLRFNPGLIIPDLEAAGFDGIKMVEDGATSIDSGTIWFPFKPTQIKSAIGNRGTYDPANPNILMSGAEQLEIEYAPPTPTQKQLAQDNMDLALRIGRMFKVPGQSADEIASEALFGLVKAANTYDADKGPFRAYAGTVIRNHLKTLFTENRNRASREVSLNYENEEGGTLEDTVARSEESIRRSAEEDDTTEIIQRAVAKLPEKPQAMVRDFMAGRGYEELAEKYGVSVSGAHKTVQNALELMRKHLRKMGVKGTDQGVLYSGAEASITQENIGQYRGNVDASPLVGRQGDIWKLFDRTKLDPARGRLIPLARVVSTKNELLDPKFLAGKKSDPRATAISFMAKRLAGDPEARAREPIDVVESSDGSFFVKDGNATVQALMLAGWRIVPANVIPRDPLLSGREGKRGEIIRGQQLDVFDNYATGAEDFTLSGETAKDYTGIVDEQAAAVEAKQKAAKDQMSLFASPESPEFKAWFGDSKVVDENGRPLVVYHGTDAQFSRFRAGRLGVWMANTKEFAGQWGSRIIPAYVKLQNPYVYQDSGYHMAELDSPAEIRRLKAAGHDGVIVRNRGNPLVTYLVFNRGNVLMRDGLMSGAEDGGSRIRMARELKNLRAEGQERQLTVEENARIDELDRALGQDFLGFFEDETAAGVGDVEISRAERKIDQLRDSITELEALREAARRNALDSFPGSDRRRYANDYNRIDRQISKEYQDLYVEQRALLEKKAARYLRNGGEVMETPPVKQREGEDRLAALDRYVSYHSAEAQRFAEFSAQRAKEPQGKAPGWFAYQAIRHEELANSVREERMNLRHERNRRDALLAHEEAERQFRRQQEERAAQEERDRKEQATKSEAAGPQMSLFASAESIDSPAFKKWFGGSKVAYADGRPKTVFHGTTQDFTEFDLNRGGSATEADSARVGLFFTDSPSTASAYATLLTGRRTREFQNKIKEAERRKDWAKWEALQQEYEEYELQQDRPEVFDTRLDGANVMPVYLALKNPLSFDFAGRPYEDGRMTRVIAQALAAGNDGVIFANIQDDPSDKNATQTVYVAFDPTQVKSAIGNRGTFDPNDPNILNSSPEDDAEIARMMDELARDIPAAQITQTERMAQREQPGQRTIGNPALANPARTEQARAFLNAVDEARVDTAERQAHEDWRQEAVRMIAADRAGVLRDLLERASDGRGYDDPVMVKAAQILVNDLVQEAVTTRDPKTMRDAQILAWSYREGGTEQARALAARRDPFKSPADRFREFLAGALFAPAPKARAAILKQRFPAAKAREMDRLRGLVSQLEAKKLADPREFLPEDTAELARLRVELGKMEAEKGRAEAVAAAANDRVKRVEDELGKMGVTLEDIFGGEAYLRLRSAQIIDNAAAKAGYDESKKKALKLIQKGWSNAEVAKKSGLTEKQVADLEADFIAKIEARLDSLGDAALDVAKFDVEALFAGEAGAAPASTLSAEERAKRKAEIIRAMGFGRAQERETRTKRALSRPRRRRSRSQSIPTVDIDFDQVREGRARGSQQQIGEPNPAVPGQTPAVPGTAAPDVRGGNRQLELAEDPDALPPVFDISDPVDVAQVARVIQAADSNGFDMAYEFWINSVLSGPLTHSANIIGNTANAAWDMTFKRFGEVALNAAFVRNGDSPQVGELRRMLAAIQPALAIGWRNALRSWTAETSLFHQEALDAQLQLTVDDKAGGAAAAIPGQAGRIVRIPGRLLVAADEFFKNVIAHVEVAAQAYRIAKSEGLTGDRLEARIRGLVNLPGSRAWLAAVKRAEELTFQDAHEGQKQGVVLHWLAQGKQKVPGLRYIIPFVRTPWNIFGQGLRQSPVGIANLLGRFAQAGFYRVRDGKPIAESYPTPEAVRHTVEQLIAWTAASLIYGAAAGDDDDEEKAILITGTVPYRSPGQSALDQRTGNQSFMVRIGDYQFGYGRVEPFATVLGLTADMIRSVKQAKTPQERFDGLGFLMESLAAQTEQKTFLRGIGDIISAVNETRKGERANYAANFASAFVPNILRQPIRELDPYIRQTRRDGFASDFASRVVPQINERKVDLYGQEVQRSGAAAWRVVVPIVARKSPSIERVDKLLVNWNQANSGDSEKQYYPSPVSSSIRVGKRTVPITPKEQHDYAVERGRLAANMLKGAALNVQNPTEADIKRIKTAFETAGQIARGKIFGAKAREIVSP